MLSCKTSKGLFFRILHHLTDQYTNYLFRGCLGRKVCKVLSEVLPVQLTARLYGLSFFSNKAGTLQAEGGHLILTRIVVNNLAQASEQVCFVVK